MEQLTAFTENMLSPEFIRPLFALAVAFILLKIGQKLCSNIAAFVQISLSVTVGIGTRLRYPLATGHMDMEISDITFRKVWLENDEAKIPIPNREFIKRDLIFLK